MSKETAPKLREFSFEISEIQTKAFTWKIPKTNIGGSLLEFSGFYRRGSAGTNDAIHISNQIDLFYRLSRFRFSALIIDLRKLDYVWGDNLIVKPPQWHIRQYPFKVVIPSEEENPDCYKGFLGVISKEVIVTDILEAFKYIRETLTAKKI